MRKQFIKFTAIALGLSTIALTGCKKVETTSPSDEAIGKATIKGVVYINTDQTEKDDDMERAEGASILVTYDAAELSVTSDGDTEIKAISATTDGEGKFQVEVPSNLKGVTYEVQADQFETEYMLKELDADNEEIVVKKQGVFGRKSTSVSIKTGQIQTVELNYGSTPEVDLSK